MNKEHHQVRYLITPLGTGGVVEKTHSVSVDSMEIARMTATFQLGHVVSSILGTCMILKMCLTARSSLKYDIMRRVNMPSASAFFSGWPPPTGSRAGGELEELGSLRYSWALTDSTDSTDATDS